MGMLAKATNSVVSHGGLAGLALSALTKKKKPSGMPSQSGQSPLGMSPQGNVAGASVAARGQKSMLG